MSRVIGITGGIASGKSTVSSYLRSKGYSVIDADAVVHQLQDKGGALYLLLLEEFGATIVDETGALNRKKLADLVFGNQTERERLSRLQDTIIRSELAQQKAHLLEQEELVFMDIPLLFELGYEEMVDKIWLVYVEEDQQLSRLMRRNQLSEDEARSRLAAQLSLEEKKAKSDNLIDNRAEVSETYARVDELLQLLENE